MPHTAPPGYDHKNPDVRGVMQRRANILLNLRKNLEALPFLLAHYREEPAQMITDWGITFDPRNIERGLPAYVPMVLWPRQVELTDFILARWREGRPGLVEKSRDGGASWVAVALSCVLCNVYDGMAIGFGSRKEEYVDKVGAPKSLFEKGRTFMSYLPVEFRRGWNRDRDCPHMRMNFPATSSYLGGEAGDNIGRGDRTAIYFVDESAHLERPQLVEASLSQTTNCRIDMSSVNGRNNPFADKRHGGKIDVFILDWRDDPRKDEAWHAKQENELDPITLAQEVDRDYNRSVASMIPAKWVEASVDAHMKLGIRISGECMGALDVADEGIDKNGFVGGRGILIERIEEWSGEGGDIFQTTRRAMDLCENMHASLLRYDEDGLGVGVRGDAAEMNKQRRAAGRPVIEVEGYRGSGAVQDPNGKVNPGDKGPNARTNDDFFANAKAQNWWHLRTLFKNTYRALTTGERPPEDQLISISSQCPRYRQLISEIPQATYTPNNIGKIVVDKSPDGAKSPNLTDALVIRRAKRGKKAMRISAAALAGSAA